MTTMVDKLIDEGFAERKRDGADRRKVVVSLTPKGKKIRAQFLANRRKAAHSIFSKLTEKDRKELLTSLDKVCTILEKSITSDRTH
jgi:DNA-binding MarR family transcriptional regulator